MNLWINRDGMKIFAGNLEDEAQAAQAAMECSLFAEDAEDELVSDAPVTCLNCRYRRWIPGGFTCQKP